MTRSAQACGAGRRQAGVVKGVVRGVGLGAPAAAHTRAQEGCRPAQPPPARPPHFEQRAVRRLGRVVDQPGCHVAQLMRQRALQLGHVIQHLGTQLHARRVAASGRASGQGRGGCERGTARGRRRGRRSRAGGRGLPRLPVLLPPPLPSATARQPGLTWARRRPPAPPSCSASALRWWPAGCSSQSAGRRAACPRR